jgi:hypothetical protein
MAHKRQYNRKPNKRTSSGPRTSVPQAPRVVYERKPPVQYGKPFVLLEDESKNTFEYSSGTWTPYELSIAQCRQDYMVKELPQKVNGKTRYEVRCPLPAAE